MVRFRGYWSFRGYCSLLWLLLVPHGLGLLVFVPWLAFGWAGTPTIVEKGPGDSMERSHRATMGFRRDGTSQVMKKRNTQRGIPSYFFFSLRAVFAFTNTGLGIIQRRLVRQYDAPHVPLVTQTSTTRSERKRIITAKSQGIQSDMLRFGVRKPP